MNLLGQTVKHEKFGRGVITELSENKVTVAFQKTQKLFLYPDAFPKYLTMKNHSIQESLEKLNEERIRVEQEQKEEAERESEYRNRIFAMKIPLKSQMAYDMPEWAWEGLEELEFVETGSLLSGSMKGTPRIPSHVQPNSAVLFTGCNDGEESQRKILGVAMADDSFWGNECEDGQIMLHKEYRLTLPEESQIPFWKYFGNGDRPARWGRIPFKYFQNQTMQRILQDLCQSAAETQNEEQALEFYEYFCSINRV